MTTQAGEATTSTGGARRAGVVTGRGRRAGGATRSGTATTSTTCRCTCRCTMSCTSSRRRTFRPSQPRLAGALCVGTPRCHPEDGWTTPTRSVDTDLSVRKQDVPR